MPEISAAEATERLIREVEVMSPDDLAAFHDELFPAGWMPRGLAEIPRRDDRRAIVDYLARGLEIEEIVGLWDVAFPRSWSVHYDEETERICYRDEPEESWASESL